MTDVGHGVVLVHYHLRRGGVTRVIAAAARDLAASGIPHVVLCGEAPAEPAEFPVGIVPGLMYRNGRSGAGTLVKELRRAVRRSLGDRPVVWHFHNHALGRNPDLAPAVAKLAVEGEAMVLQLHDLVEDGRPENFPVVAGDVRLYPHSARVRLAFLNGRDRSRFISAGLPASRATILPNPVDVAPLPAAERGSPARIFYPVRGIRRKNLGEVFLLAALAPRGSRFAVSRPPESARWMPVYRGWQRFVRSSGLPVRLGVSDRIAPVVGKGKFYGEWLADATHLLSTSVAEGFGFAFLEALALGRPLIGRHLPVVEDFVKAGVMPGSLHEGISVPLDWIGADALRRRLEVSLRCLRSAYGRDTTADDAGRAWAAMVKGDRVDFGNLPEDLQRMVIRRVLQRGQAANVQVRVAGESRPARGWLREVLAIKAQSSGPADLPPWSPMKCGAALRRLHRAVAMAAPGEVGWLEPDRVLDRYLAPEEFHFLRSP